MAGTGHKSSVLERIAVDHVGDGPSVVVKEIEEGDTFRTTSPQRQLAVARRGACEPLLPGTNHRIEACSKCLEVVQEIIGWKDGPELALIVGETCLGDQ